MILHPVEMVRIPAYQTDSLRQGSPLQHLSMSLIQPCAGRFLLRFHSHPHYRQQAFRLFKVLLIGEE
jgi:hypothetical protein